MKAAPCRLPFRVGNRGHGKRGQANRNMGQAANLAWLSLDRAHTEDANPRLREFSRILALRRPGEASPAWLLRRFRVVERVEHLQSWSPEVFVVAADDRES